MRSLIAGALFSLMVATGLQACGGDVVVDRSTDSSGDDTTSTATDTTPGTTATGTTATTTAGQGCDEQGDCPPNSICIFETGVCATVCFPDDAFSTCGRGEVCNGCATGSCPGCLDCVAACVPAEEGQCDDHDDCDADELCLFGAQRCSRGCGEGQVGCLRDDQFCDPCATSSCPGCEDCLAACTPP
ncbi:MAG: hypothetical protein AAGA56_22845 [Myxococcota bacterium]